MNLGHTISDLVHSHCMGFCRCVQVTTDPPSSCDNDEEDKKVQGRKMCGMITDPDGVFDDCYKALKSAARLDDVEQIFKDCRYDLCVIKVCR